MKKLFAITFALLALTYSGAESGCKGPVPPPAVIADDVKVDVTSACTTITAVVQDVVVSLVCVTAEEAAALADLIAHQISASIADSGTPKCVAAQGQSICATPDQMAAAIRIMNSRRAHTDGGHL